MGSLAHLEAYQRPLAWEVHQLASWLVRLADSNEGGVIVQNRAESSLVVEVKENQYNDPLLAQLKEGIYKHKTTTFSLGMDDGTQRYQGRLCVPDIEGLRERIMAEAHTSKYSVHPGSTKIYHDLKEVCWWTNMKRDVVGFVAKYPNCQQVNDEHQRPSGLAQSIETPMWKWEMINMDFVVGLPRTPRKFDTIWVSPMKGIMWFGKKGKLSLRKLVGDPSTIVPVETIEVNGELSYVEIPVSILDRWIGPDAKETLAKKFWKFRELAKFGGCWYVV
ncbi:uncharacterized protein [Nicotiana sylvestris]|uniref:uncharacterized protein n=1 Tax=Nicotiana sylvestris TaxID=4096 RepID=UPI00388CBEA4